ncbi:baeRF3 domain-containing protein [Dactylosporangium matsuzakiense]|uniref:Uncharacterized protein n=1 Tax=Dactylosporangium matsuzakiense TaxID=53360 RepID=A0A9W6KB46_9ACTN|nr:hypothetical protein [Dactylosporangium matsuzakiense]UWZ47264.1 hypothetical protein Dmats_13160 [Dactylosporangium matsuzakiense]GLK98282.1 hypothetical protein GCM10017581_000230 [Dactylosporangium matsuzakiense]
MTVKELATLTPSGYPAVSLLMPTHRTAPDSLQDPIRLRNLLAETRRRLETDETVPGEVASAVYHEIVAAADQVDLRHSGEGLAVFASPGEVHVRVLDSPVQERVVVADTYEVRDVVADAVRRHRYWAIALSEQPTRLWSGDGAELVEVTSHGFPFIHDEAGLPRDYGQEPSKYEIERHRRFFREVAVGLAEVDRLDARPVFVLGVDRYLAYFAAEWPRPFAGTVLGNYDHAGPHDVYELLAPRLAAYTAAEQAAALERLDAARGANRFAGGLAEVWSLAHQGRGAHLVVEEGFHSPALVHDDHLHPVGEDAPGVPIDDAVDDIVESVVRQGGEVTFVGDGSLDADGRIALILRY